MINLIRIYIVKGKETNVIDLPFSELKAERKRLKDEGWSIYHSTPL